MNHQRSQPSLYHLQPSTGVAAAVDAVGVGATATTASGSPDLADMAKLGAADGAGAAGIS